MGWVKTLVRCAPCGLLAFCVCGTALAQAAKPKGLPRADFFAACPFTVAPPSVVVVLDAARWRSVLGAARVTPAPYEAGDTDFKRETIFIVALPNSPAAATEAALSAKKPERFDAKTGTLTIYYEVNAKPTPPGELAASAIGQPCLVSWTAARKDLQQVVTRSADGRYIAGARTAEKPAKKP